MRESGLRELLDRSLRQPWCFAMRRSTCSHARGRTRWNASTNGGAGAHATPLPPEATAPRLEAEAPTMPVGTNAHIAAVVARGLAFAHSTTSCGEPPRNHGERARRRGTSGSRTSAIDVINPGAGTCMHRSSAARRRPLTKSTTALRDEPTAKPGATDATNQWGTRELDQRHVGGIMASEPRLSPEARPQPVRARPSQPLGRLRTGRERILPSSP